MYKEKLADAVIGFAIGDAFGVPYEFSKRNSVKVPYMIGHGTWNQLAGTWSDDTSMLLATLDAIDSDTININTLTQNFLKWCIDAKYTARNEIFDIGHRTREALMYYINNENFMGGDVLSNGNGSLMRILPLAFISFDDNLINEVSAITHPHDISKACCRIYVKFIRYMLDHPNVDKSKLCKFLTSLDMNESYILDMSKILGNNIDNIQSDAYVVNTLEAVFWTFFHTNSYKKAIITATNLGGDTDTIAAITGAIVGIYYGINSIPDDWNLANAELIINIIKKAQKNIK